MKLRILGFQFGNPFEVARLQHLNLDNSPVTDAGMVHLQHLAELRTLNLGMAAISDAGLAHGQGLTRLKKLEIWETKVTDAGLAHLRGLKNLEYLDLTNLRVTDAGLLHLHGLPKLHWLFLTGTKVTAPGVAALVKALPGLEVVRDDDPPRFALHAMDTGLRGPDVPKLTDKVRLLKDLGFTGIDYTFNPQELPQLLKLLDEHRLELHAIYLNLPLDKKLDPALAAAVPLLKGRPTRIETTIVGGGGKRAIKELDAQVVALLQELSDKIGDTGPVVSIYPHIGVYAATEDDALRLVRLADRKNVGMNFNLYHSPRRQNLKDMEKFLTDAQPHLKCVTINGLDKGRIVPLDQGQEFALPPFLALLQRIGYHGPVGLQGYGIPGPSREHLSRSMKVWRAALTGP